MRQFFILKNRNKFVKYKFKTIDWLICIQIKSIKQKILSKPQKLIILKDNYSYLESKIKEN